MAAFLAPLLLLITVVGQRIGEPVADDYDYLYHLFFTKGWSWLDGGGANVYWRPIGRQVFYAAFGSRMLNAPALVALVQFLCLCLSSALLYRAFRRSVGRGVAFAVSTAPWLMESSRLLVAWPSCFQDVGALLFVALALHEATAGRRWTFLGAGLVALLCKEVAAVALLSILFCPAVRLGDGDERRRWWIATGLLILLWAIAYVAVSIHAALKSPVTRPPGSSLEWAQGLFFIPWWSFKAIWSQAPLGVLGDVLLFALLGLGALVPWSRLRGRLADPELRFRDWWAFGLFWSVPLIVTLVPLYPSWAAYRFAFVGFGLVTALTITAGALHRLAIPILLALRFVLLLLAPRPVTPISTDPPFRGASIDVPQISRLQSLVAEVRSRLQSEHPRLPSGATVIWEGFPGMTDFALARSRALCVWYGDSTLRWVGIGSWIERGLGSAATIVEFQPGARRQVALVEPEAMRAMLRANDGLTSGREAESLRWLARAESLQADTTARAFLKSVAGKRDYALASLSFRGGRYEEARGHLLSLLARYPRDVPGRRLLKAVEDSVIQATPR